VTLSKPGPAPKQITFKVESGPSGVELMKRVVQCGDSLGGPPQRSSLQVAGARTYVLYLPKKCLLDPSVARSSASAAS